MPAGERTETDGSPAVELVDGAEQHWVVRGFEPARAVLRSAEQTVQAGFGAEGVRQRADRMRPPILYLEGTPHHVQRKATAHFFAPRTVEAYRPMMQALADELVGTLRTDRWTDLSDLSLRMAVQVAGRVVGLTDSSVRGMERRLDAFFQGDPTVKVRSLRALVMAVRSNGALLRFHRRDVRPAIRARRRERREDVISQLLDAGYTDLEILTECVTYGAAGMVTMREFITVVVWHLLADPQLLARFRGGDVDERVAILDEVLRLQPVVGHLWRRTTATLRVEGPDGAVEIPAGTLVDVDVRAANVDPSAAGADPVDLCPGRPLDRGVPGALLGFGDGHHRCPGAPIALLETEVFVTTLLRRDVEAAGPPEVRWNPVSQGYELDGFRVRLRG